MKRKFLSTLLIATLVTTVGLACEIKLSITGDKKEFYKEGDEVIVEAIVIYTHRVCELTLSDTKFTADGLKILGGTPWKESSPGTFTRQLKIQVLKDSKKEGIIKVERSCKKEGGFGTLTLKKE
ncbi:MAG: hypothetical protein CVU10_09715 [Bacteroidetes bacterium HGW-Bacteroidetes-5]|jgi:hypothetical protein|nr:MAG: hypothetical protein CVU10_09715 [Bacteroidetes bacterium HGW-Bacteroidetes-5]